jgi:DNA polymerase III alpha subunit
MRLQTIKAFNDVNRMRFSNDQFYFKTRAQMEERFFDIPEAP